MSGRQKSINASQARATRTIRSDRAVIERQKDLLKKWERENPIQAQRKRDFVGGLAAALRCKGVTLDRKSTRLNSSHTVISYAVFCLKKIKRILLVDQNPDTL